MGPSQPGKNLRNTSRYEIGETSAHETPASSWGMPASGRDLLVPVMAEDILDDDGDC